jgi:hypothetical protein
MSKSSAKPPQQAHKDEEATALETHLTKRWVAPAFFLLFTAIYFAGFIFSGEVMEGLDVRQEFYLGKEPATEKIADLAPENWDRYLGGTPVSGWRQPKYFPLYPIYVLTTFHRYMGWRYFFATFFAGYFTYLCIRGLRLRRVTAVLSGIAYASSPTLLTFIYPGQEGKMLVMGLLPLMVWALYRIMDTRKPVFACLLGAGVAAGIYTPHLQMLYYALIGLGLLFVVRLVQTWLEERDTRLALIRSALAATGIIIGLAVGAVGTFPAYKYTKTESRRAGDQGQGVSLEYAQSWSLHPEEIAALLIPEFVHFYKPETRQNLYWGRNALKLNTEYFGIVVLFFAAMAIARIREDKRVLPLVLLAVITLAFALGPHTPIFLFFYHFVPGMNVLRTPGMIAFLFAFSAVVLAALSLDRLLDAKPEGDTKRILTYGGGLGVLFALIALAPAGALSAWSAIFWPDMPSEKAQIASANLPSLSTGAMLGCLWVAGLVALVTLRLKQKIPAQTFVLALLPILIIDTWRVDKQYLRYLDPDRFPDPQVYIPTTLGIIESDSGFHRTWVPAADVELPDVDLLTVSYHEPFILRRYDTVTHTLNQLYRRRSNEQLLKLLNVLNVRYVATSAQRLQEFVPAVIAPGSTEDNVMLRSGFEAVSNERSVYLFRNQNARPFFYLASHPVHVDDEDQALQAITSETFDPAREVVLENEPGVATRPEISSSETVSVNTFDERTGHIELTVNVDHPSVVVISQNYHPHWSARIDGQSTRIHRANYVWQAVTVPAGNHTIVLSYHDPLAQACRWISLISLVLLIAGSFYFYRASDDTPTREAA